MGRLQLMLCWPRLNGGYRSMEGLRFPVLYLHTTEPADKITMRYTTGAFQPVFIESTGIFFGHDVEMLHGGKGVVDGRHYLDRTFESCRGLINRLAHKRGGMLGLVMLNVVRVVAHGIYSLGGSSMKRGIMVGTGTWCRCRPHWTTDKTVNRHACSGRLLEW